jgi:hypothetical protein
MLKLVAMDRVEGLFTPVRNWPQAVNPKRTDSHRQTWGPGTPLGQPVKTKTCANLDIRVE